MRTATVTACAAQGLSCFHQYQQAALKTLSIDMLYSNLEAFSTVTTLNQVERGESMEGKEDDRAYEYIGSVTKQPIVFETENNFEPDVGLASSSSGYACLAGGLTKILSLSEETKDVSRLARMGSFSASASVAGGISMVRRANRGVPTYGEQIFAPDDLLDITVVVAFSRYNKAKHNFYQEADSSPMLDSVRELVADTANEMVSALDKRDIDRLAMLSERHSVLNYAVLHTGQNDLFLWQPHTVAAMNFARNLRQKNGEPVFYSMNTGANVFIYCFSDSAHRKVMQGLNDMDIEHKSSKIGGGLQYLDASPTLV